MSLLICTPVYRDVTVPYLKSLMSLQETFLEIGVDHDFLFIENESLIQRARNNAAARFLALDYEKLLFIDADIEFTPQDVETLWNMNEKVAVAAYPMKKPGSDLTAWKGGKLVKLDELEDITPVDYAGTGFMMIDRSVLEGMKNYPHIEGRPEGGTIETYAWFNPRVVNGVYLSEDYAFCLDCREQIMLNSTIRLTHWGSFGYTG